MEITTTLATTVAGGVLRRTVLTLLGTATWTTPMAVQTEAAPIREMGFLLGASGIKRFGVDYSNPEPVEG